MNNVPRDDDPQNELVSRRDAGAAKRMVPKAGEIGALTRKSTTRASRRSTGRVGGSDVAPTARAAAREQARHRAERKMGRRAAGSAGADSPRKGTSRASRGQLVDAGRKADEAIAGRPIPSRAGGGRSATARRRSARPRDDQR